MRLDRIRRTATITLITVSSNPSSGVEYVTVAFVNVELDDDTVVRNESVFVRVAEGNIEIADVVDVNWGCRFKVIVPGPVKFTAVEMFEPEQSSPPEQLQLETA